MSDSKKDLTARAESIATETETLGQLFRYGVVGLTLNGLGFLVYLALTVYFQLNPITVVSVLYPLSVLTSYLFNRRWTFRDTTSATVSFFRFLISHIAGYLINIGLLWLLWTKLAMPHPLVQAAAIFIVAGFLFIAFRFFVFRPTMQHQPASPVDRTRI